MIDIWIRVLYTTTAALTWKLRQSIGVLLENHEVKAYFNGLVSYSLASLAKDQIAR